MISTYVAVWWLSRLSEKFFERNEEYKSNKRVIERKLEYSEKVKISREQKEIRDLESDKKSIRWEDNSEFNQSIDDANNVLVSGIDMQPSEVLYNSDYEAYKEQFVKVRFFRPPDSLLFSSARHSYKILFFQQ